MERRTEARNPRARRLSSMSTREILELLNDEDTTVPAAVRRAIPEIERAVELIVASLAKGGHLFYVGAGTSGRLGVLDARELRPTNAKLRERAIRMVAAEAAVPADEAERRLERWGWHVRAAIEDRWPGA